MFTLPTLEYDFAALEPHISKDIMELHYSKHHQTYVDKLNAAIKDVDALQEKTIEDILRDLDGVPEDIRAAVRNNGGGHYNHSLFWQWLSPDGGGQPEGPLLAAIIEKYGSFAVFQEEFTAASLGVFGSGWVWLMPDLSIISTPNQDTPISQGLPTPLLGLDIWEHAYYLDYKNKRPEYVSAWWNVVNWSKISGAYQA